MKTTPNYKSQIYTFIYFCTLKLYVLTYMRLKAVIHIERYWWIDLDRLMQPTFNGLFFSNK